MSSRDVARDSKLYSARVKTASRTHVRKFVEQHTTPEGRRELKVLFLPGPTDKEIIQVFDPLGIPRQNMIGAERDPKVIEALLKTRGTRQISVQKGDITEVLKSSQFGFNLVSMDFTGEFTNDNAEAIKAAVLRLQPGKRGFIHVNIYASRENKVIQNRYQNQRMRHVMNMQIKGERKGERPTIPLMLDEEGTFYTHQSDIDDTDPFPKKRLSALLDIFEVSADPRPEEQSYPASLFDAPIEVKQKAVNDSDDARVHETAKFGLDHVKGDTPLAQQLFYNATCQAYDYLRLSELGLSWNQAAMVIDGSLGFNLACSSGHLQGDYSFYTYKNEHGKRFLGCIFCFEPLPDVVSGNHPLYQELSQLTGVPVRNAEELLSERVLTKIAGLGKRRLIDIAFRRVKEVCDVIEDISDKKYERIGVVPEVTDLGSEIDMKKRADAIAEEIYGLLRGGKTPPEEIMHRFNLDPREMAAYKANFTMGRGLAAKFKHDS